MKPETRMFKNDKLNCTIGTAQTELDKIFWPLELFFATEPRKMLKS